MTVLTLKTGPNRLGGTSMHSLRRARRLDDDVLLTTTSESTYVMRAEYHPARGQNTAVTRRYVSDAKEVCIFCTLNLPSQDLVPDQRPQQTARRAARIKANPRRSVNRGGHCFRCDGCGMGKSTPGS